MSNSFSMSDLWQPGSSSNSSAKDSGRPDAVTPASLVVVSCCPCCARSVRTLGCKSRAPWTTSRCRSCGASSARRSSGLTLRRTSRRRSRSNASWPARRGGRGRRSPRPSASTRRWALRCARFQVQVARRTQVGDRPAHRLQAHSGVRSPGPVTLLTASGGRVGPHLPGAGPGLEYGPSAGTDDAEFPLHAVHLHDEGPDPAIFEGG